MNIGKIICLLLIIPLCCGCNEHETSSAPSFRQCFIEVYYSGGLELPMLQTGYFGTQPTVPPQNLQTGFVITPNYSHNNMCDSFSDPEEFLRLATRNDDTSFNQWVPDHLCLRTPAFANNFRELHVVSNADWDEEHPAVVCWMIFYLCDFIPMPILFTKDIPGKTTIRFYPKGSICL